MGAAELVYDAAREWLSGTIGREPAFHMLAYSCGSRGHKAKVMPEQAKAYLHPTAGTLKSHLATTQEITDKNNAYKQRGGTIPPGHYRCHYLKNHPPFNECIQLTPEKDAHTIHSPFSPFPIPHGRSGFYIHGSGAKGSDGCIVPANEAERRRLNKAIKNFPGDVMLVVKNVSYMLPAELEGQLA